MNCRTILLSLFSLLLVVNNLKLNLTITLLIDIKMLVLHLFIDSQLKGIKELNSRSLNIYHKSLKRKSMVKITNPENGNSLIAEVKSNKVEFSNFYNSILSNRIVETLELDLSEPYVEISLITKESTFVAKKPKPLTKNDLLQKKLLLMEYK